MAGRRLRTMVRAVLDSGACGEHHDPPGSEEHDARLGEQILPLTEFPVFNLSPDGIESGAALTKKLAPYYEDWLKHPTYDDYWKEWSIEENYQNIQVPRANHCGMV